MSFLSRWFGGRVGLIPEVSSSRQPERPCMVHLVRAANGPDPFKAFIEALRRHPTGVDWDILLALKGFNSREHAASFLEAAHVQDLAPQVMFFSDAGLDLRIYFAVAALQQRDRYCFLNSFSEPLVEGWLAKLSRALSQPGVGLAGATGSWWSNRSELANRLGLPNAYMHVLPRQFAMQEAFRHQGGKGLARRTYGRSAHINPRVWAERSLDIAEKMCLFKGFPACHVRTNAFVVSHDTLTRLQLFEVSCKRDAYVLENGRQSMTRQVQKMGLRTVVVDRHGTAFEAREWDRSNTFWQGNQQGLLVADNQTRLYARADEKRRQWLSGYAWGRADISQSVVPGSR